MLSDRLKRGPSLLLLVLGFLVIDFGLITYGAILHDYPHSIDYSAFDAAMLGWFLLVVVAPRRWMLSKRDLLPLLAAFVVAGVLIAFAELWLYGEILLAALAFIFMRNVDGPLTKS